MKDNNKHPHDKLIGEWLKDTSKQPQFKKEGVNEEWWSCTVAFLVDDASGEYEFRFKPRKFIKGHWYPCLQKDREFICKFNGVDLVELIGKGSCYSKVLWHIPLSLDISVGKSLGEIKFGE